MKNPLYTYLDAEKYAKGSKYQGYIWMSDSSIPIKFVDKTIEEILQYEAVKNEDLVNPYILEANFCSAKVSYSIKHLDNHYIQNEYKIDDLKETTKIHYLGKESLGNMYFKQMWIEESDAMCEGMAVLLPKALVFTGFGAQKEEDKK